QPFRITGDWSILSKNLQKKFPQLTEADLKFETGEEDELIKRLETRLNKKREQVITLLKH
ncbi:MAG TPA: hypothetical protein VGK59_18965, partial [Ohtaekwangia sp.]